MQQQEDPMIAIHQEFVGSFSEHKDDILSTQAEDNNDNDEAIVGSCPLQM